jgi:hypothetical protein
MVRTPDASAGKRGRCPQCQGIVQIPAQQAAGHRCDSRVIAARVVAPEVTVSDSGESIQFFCFACGKIIRTTTAVAGKRGRCPHCREIIEVPRGNRAASHLTPPAASGELVPLPHLTPLPASRKPQTHQTPAFPDPLFGLVPEGRPGASFRGSPHDSGLEPLTPLSSLLDEVLPNVSPLPVAPSSYAASHSSWSAPSPRRTIDDRGRRGLPWERDPSTESFYDTMRYVLFAPQDAFDDMRRRGLGSPLGYYVLSSVLLSFLVVVELFALMLIYVLASAAFIHAETGQNLTIRWVPLAVAFGVSSVAAVAMGLVEGICGGLLKAAVFHMLLLACGAANAGFTATYRVVAFGYGSIVFLLLIPVLGPFFALVMHFLVLTSGFARAHETSRTRSLLAVLGATLIGLAIGGLMLLLFPPQFVFYRT